MESIKEIKIIGVGTSISKFRTIITAQSLQYSFSFHADCAVLPNLPLIIPEKTFQKYNINSSKVESELADPLYFQQGEVHIIFGASIFWSLLKFKKYSLGPALPTLQSTKLGWILTTANTLSLSSCKHKENSKRTELGMFQCAPLQPVKEMHEAEILFRSSLKIDSDGRYMVKLPLKYSPTTLGDSYGSALRRLFALERKLSMHQHLRKQYNDFMYEYLELGHMSPVHSDRNESFPAYYIPHHSVFNENSLTTKCRVVFDA